MFSKFVIFAVLAFVAVANCGVVPAAYISPYASTFNAHTINHAVAAPFVAAPAARIVASPFAPASRIVSSPYVAASPFASPYSLPYSLPYSSAYASPYSSPYVASPYVSAYSSPYSYPGSYYL